MGPQFLEVGGKKAARGCLLCVEGGCANLALEFFVPPRDFWSPKVVTVADLGGFGHKKGHFFAFFVHNAACCARVSGAGIFFSRVTWIVVGGCGLGGIFVAC